MRRIIFAVLMAAAVLTQAPKAHAEVDVNAVAVFYEDGTYSLRSWDDLEGLRSATLNFVEVMVFHVQGGGLPNVVSLSGVDCVGVARTRLGLLARRANVPPYEATLTQQRFFGDDGSQTGNIDMDILPGLVALSMTGLDAVFFTLPWIDTSYDDLEIRAGALKQFLRGAPVPSDGTY